MEQKIFKLTSLQDIYNLPTIEQMVVCLHAIKSQMIQARLLNDQMTTAAQAKGMDIKKCFHWPRTTEWTDNSKCVNSLKELENQANTWDIR